MKLFLVLFMIVLSGCETHFVNLNAKPVYAEFETQAVASDDDAADDPAIWVHPQDPSQSLILGTDKKNGLGVYDLQGQLVQFLDQGRLNNVDLRSDAVLNGHRGSFAVATNRTDKTLDIFEISSEGLVSVLFQQPLEMEDPYGVCLYRNHEGALFAFVNSSDGLYQKFWLTNDANDSLVAEKLGSFIVDSQPEGCAVDDQTNTFYFGEEEVGIWRMPADISRADERELIATTSSVELEADVEGMDVYRHIDGSVYLIASSQGDNSYAVYDLMNDASYMGSFRVELNPENGVDATQETDGLTVSSVSFDDRFPLGMLVVQDGFNENPKENQNFKAISWLEVIKALEIE